MIPPDQEITATLTAAQWNVTLAALQEAPYRVAAPVIQALMAQMPVEATAPQQVAHGNGAAHVSN